MALELTSVESEERLLRGAWEGQACVDQEEFGFRVDSEWRLPAQGPFVETRLRVRFDTNADVYLSEILHPLVYVRPSDATDLLVLPALGGYLLEDPIRNPRCLKAFGTRFPWLTVPFLAYYGARSQLCFLYGDDDHQETWLPHNVYVVPEHEELCFSTRHVPPNVFQTRSFTTPYRIRVGATKGDWIDGGDHSFEPRLDLHLLIFRQIVEVFGKLILDLLFAVFLRVGENPLALVAHALKAAAHSVDTGSEAALQHRHCE